MAAMTPSANILLAEIFRSIAKRAATVHERKFCFAASCCGIFVPARFVFIYLSICLAMDCWLLNVVVLLFRHNLFRCKSTQNTPESIPRWVEDTTSTFKLCTAASCFSFLHFHWNQGAYRIIITQKFNFYPKKFKLLEFFWKKRI